MHLRYPSNLVGRKVSITFTDQVAQTNLTRPGQDGGPRLGPQDHSPSRSCRPVNHMGVESCFPIDAGGEFSTPANTHGPLSTRILRICPKALQTWSIKYFGSSKTEKICTAVVFSSGHKTSTQAKGTMDLFKSFVMGAEKLE